MNRLKKGDKVKVISGTNAGKEGVITKINTKENTAIVEGVNVFKKHTKPSQKNDNKGGIVSIEMPINMSKLALVSAKGKRGITKVSYVIDAKGNKSRVERKTKKEIKK